MHLPYYIVVINVNYFVDIYIGESIQLVVEHLQRFPLDKKSLIFGKMAKMAFVL